MPIQLEPWPDPGSPVGQKFFTNAQTLAQEFGVLKWSHVGMVAAIAAAELETSLEWPCPTGDDGTAHGPWQHHSDRIDDVLKGCGIDLRTCSLVDAARAIDWETRAHPWLGRPDWFGCPTVRGAGILFRVQFEGAEAPAAAVRCGMAADRWEQSGRLR